MDWADELARRVRDRGPQVVNDSKTPSGTVHVGSLRGPVILDVIARALRANGVETTFLYGVDDLDPMDAQALLTPDAVETEMGVPLAHVPDQVGDCHASYARHLAGIFIDMFAGLGIHPDRYYWMSDIYPTGAMDPYIRTALDRAAVVREIYRRVANVQHPDDVAPARRHLPDLRQGRHDDRHRLGRRAGLLRVPAGPRDLGPRLRLIGLGLAVRRDGEAALEPRVGGAVDALRGDDRAVRQGPRDGRRLARPLRRDRPRGLRARAAAQRAVRVPEHRRPEDVDVEGPRRRRAHDRRGRAARAAALPVPAAPAEPRDRLRPRRHRRDPAPLRRVRPVRRGDGRPRGEGRAAARATRPRSATRCSTPTPTSRPRPPRSGRRSRTSRCSSRSRASTSRRASRRRRGAR